MVTSPQNSRVRHMGIAVLTLGLLLASQQNVQAQQATERLGLNGYCPVCVIEAKKWEPGSPTITSIYDGTTYRFPNASIKQKFDANPAKYVPALGGDCIVCYAKLGKRVPGNIRFASLHNNRLFLFPSDAEKQAFRASPKSFENVDLAAGGDCVVCLAKANKHVPGSPKHVEIHDGFRYQFPSASEAAEFRRSPKQYAVGTRMTVQGQVGRNQTPQQQRLVTISGTSACAGCEFGVTPLSNPDELGLAVKTSGGRVVVVEQAHELYPDVYSARFQGQKLRVQGQVVKIDGKIAWLKPSSVEVIN